MYNLGPPKKYGNFSNLQYGCPDFDSGNTSLRKHICIERQGQNHLSNLSRFSSMVGKHSGQAENNRKTVKNSTRTPNADPSSLPLLRGCFTFDLLLRTRRP